ncbi:MAG: hypothetical protein JXB03_12795 [Spirochaetales bacterium]|nr:hypothetical protein [Spirochaetales bacterium]
MDFGEPGCSRVILCGRNGNENNSIHLRFQHDGGDNVCIVDFAGTPELSEQSFSFEPVKGLCKLTLMFMPGSNFDVKWFQFLKHSTFLCLAGFYVAGLRAVMIV